MFFTRNTKIASHYYDSLISEAKRSDFESAIMEKVQENEMSEVFTYEDFIVSFKQNEDIVICLIGSLKTNELIFEALLDTISAAMNLVYKIPDSNSVIQQIEYLYFIIDETIDQGFVFEGDPNVVASRVLLKGDNSFTGKGISYVSKF
ncbi:coatomer zeta subunit [Histomonas meleagridis]|uniref:coatomer zeta subunit n=1 Tax=Histomonas meleagridis TaxID=135588 RepID=UPI00355A39FD|nr:coatomer zeta subunit [Histomonas meleagridis]KAH0804792.1 coatomer zeta subunit [Histomonas meleagridis]